MSTDQAIRDADLYYTQLEANLQEKVNRIEADHTGYDRYRYNIDEIGHDPFILISYLSAKYEIFEFDSQVKADLDALFAAQYIPPAVWDYDRFYQGDSYRNKDSPGRRITGTGSDFWLLQLSDMLWAVVRGTDGQWCISTGKSYDCRRRI